MVELGDAAVAHGAVLGAQRAPHQARRAEPRRLEPAAHALRQLDYRLRTNNIHPYLLSYLLLGYMKLLQRREFQTEQNPIRLSAALQRLEQEALYKKIAYDQIGHHNNFLPQQTAILLNKNVSKHNNVTVHK